MAPVILALGKLLSEIDLRIIATGQQISSTLALLREFGLEPDLAWEPSWPAAPSLCQMLSYCLEKLDGTYAANKTEVVLAVGDTTSVLAAALAAHGRGAAFCHIEAGLRSGRRDAPFPEETHRVLAAQLARVHFAPTRRAAVNLLNEGIGADRVHLVGNTVIDALGMQGDEGSAHGLRIPTDEYVVATAHRREHWGQPLGEILSAVSDLLAERGNLSVVWPVHPNPQVRRQVESALAGHRRVVLCEPLGYREFVTLMRGAVFVMTDSGGVQEEAPALGRRVLAIRAATERLETIEAGMGIGVAPERRPILLAARRLLASGSPGRGRNEGIPPYGDGRSAVRIVQVLGREFGFNAGEPPGDLDRWPAEAGAGLVLADRDRAGSCGMRHPRRRAAG